MTQPVDALRLRLRGDVVEELPADAEHTALRIHLGLPDLLQPAAEGVHDVFRIGRGTDRGECRDLGYPVRGGQHGRAAQRMPDEERQPPGGRIVPDVLNPWAAHVQPFARIRASSASKSR